MCSEISSIVSKQRVQDHGEVFTPNELVGQMLNLVSSECEREDSRFLEPACGNGNFLAEVLQRRLINVTIRHRSQTQWEVHALLGLSCLYGIELLPDNVGACRQRLVDIFMKHYASLFTDKINFDVQRAAHTIMSVNIILGDALAMTSEELGRKGQPILMTEWALVGRGYLKRSVYEYKGLSPLDENGSLFDSPRNEISDEEGNMVFIPRHIYDLPLVHYTKLEEVSIQ
jgi:hypothetical protein